MDLKKVRAAVLVEQQYQEMEVWYPVYRLREAGCTVTLVGPEAGTTYPSKLGYPAKSDKAAKDVSANDFDLVVMGTRGRMGLLHLLVGSVAEKVVRHCARPVLTVRAPKP